MSSSNFKTIYCRFFAKNKCNKGDNCTFKHGENDPLAPKLMPMPVWNVINNQTDNDLAENLNIKTWIQYPSKYNYHITGPKDECMKYYNEWILTQYPENPYFTRISEEGEDYIKVTRSTTSD